MAGLVTVPELELVAQTDTSFTEEQEAVAQACIDDASALIHMYCQREDDPWTEETVPAGIAAICKRVAAGFLKNPDQRTSYTGQDGQTIQGGRVTIFTSDDRDLLDRFRARKVQVGSIQMGLPSYLRPIPADEDTEEA